MKINTLKIDEIFIYSRNAKKHPFEQIKNVSKSIERFGWAQPLVVDGKNELIIGHCRLEAAKLLGLTEVPVVTMDGLSPKEVKALRLADNKLNESDWDMSLVREELKDLEDIELLNLTGFSEDLILEDDEQDDVLPEIPSEPQTKLGDIYELGNHRVICGDATNEDVAKLMNGVQADMVFTDPPYNINYKGQGKNTSNHIKSDNLEDDQFDSFLNEVFARYRENVKTGAPLYVFHASSTQQQFEKAMDRNDFVIKNQIIWNKPMSALGWGDYRWKHEPFFYAGRKGAKIQFYGDRTHSTVWDFQKSENDLVRWAKKMKKLEAEGRTTIWSMKREKVNEYLHPTQKPVELIQYALANSSKSGDIIMDLFLGSGSTLILQQKKQVEHAMGWILTLNMLMLLFSAT